MKKLLVKLIPVSLFTLVFAQANAQTANLNNVTFGFGAGYSSTFNKTYDYSLTPDASNNLKLQALSKQAFVISSVVIIKLGKIAVDNTSNTLLKQANVSQYNAIKKQSDALKTHAIGLQDSNDLQKTQRDIDSLEKQQKKSTGLTFWDHLSINLSTDLANITPDVSFNKNVNGGLGIGYFITSDLQFALFYDVSRISQLRDYIVDNYQNKPIPNGSGSNYNALDTGNSTLFYNKTISGLSFKLVFSLANKNASQPGQ